MIGADDGLVLAVSVVLAIALLGLVVAALGLAAGGANAPRRDSTGWNTEARSRSAPRRNDVTRRRR